MTSTLTRCHIEEIISNIDFLETISYVSIYKLIDGIFRNKNSEVANFLQIYPITSFLVAISLKHEYQKKKSPTADQIELLLDLLSKYFEDLSQDFANLINSKGQDHEVNFLQLQVGMQYLVTKDNPETFEFQTSEFLQKVPSKFNDYFFNRFGFSVDDAILFYQKINSRHAKLLTNRIKKIEKIRENYKQFQNFRNGDKDDRSHEIINDAVSTLFSNSQDPYLFRFDEFVKNENVEKIDEFKKYLNMLSCKFGQGEQGYDSPLDPNIFDNKPIINLENDTFFCPNPHMLFYKLPVILENFIKEIPSQVDNISTKYFEKKSEYLETKIQDYLSRIFKGNIIHKNCEFQTENGEVDILIEFDNKILIVEAKSGNINPVSKRGGIKSLIKDLEDLIEEANEQGRKAREYIKSSEAAKFVDGDGNEFEIKYKPGHTQFYLLSVTLEPFSALATNPKTLKALGLFENDDYSWTVNLSDFDIITRILPSPGFLLHFMRQRLDAINTDMLFSGNELAFLSWYLKIGSLGLSEQYRKTGQKIALSGEVFSDITDHYTKGTPIPVLEIESEILDFIKILEKTRPENYTNIIFLLLDQIKSMRTDFVNGMKTVTEKTNSDHTPHDFTLRSNELDVGISFVASPPGFNIKSFTEHCELRKYQTRMTRWLGILRILENKIPLDDIFVYFEYPYEENKVLAEKSKRNPLKK